MRLTPIVGSIILYPPFLAYSVRAKKRTRHKRERATAKIWQTPVLVFVSPYFSFLGFSLSRCARFVSTEVAPLQQCAERKREAKEAEKEVEQEEERRRKRKWGGEEKKGRRTKKEERRKKRRKKKEEERRERNEERRRNEKGGTRKKR